MLTSLLAALAVISLLTTLWQFLAAMLIPLHRRNTALNKSASLPSVTILKPLKGCDLETRHCLTSWFQQQYSGPVQILFGVADPNDPVCALVRELLARHPGVDAQLCVCPENLGANAKVSTLIQLTRLARYEMIIVSDADVCVPADLLTQLLPPLSDPATGLVNCFYTLANPSTLAMRCEAVAINADFWSQVLQSQSLKPLDFALGAVMATTKTWLAKIGGFAALANHLADDYQLGHRIAKSGGKILLSTVVVECRSAPLGWREVWAHQLRWARTIRICQPVPWFFSIVSNATLWPWLWLCFQPTPPVLFAAFGCWVVRMGTALVNQSRLTRTKHHLFYDWLVLVKDFFHACLWAMSFAGNTVHWRGQTYRVTRGGVLEPV